MSFLCPRYPNIVYLSSRRNFMLRWTFISGAKNAVGARGQPQVQVVQALALRQPLSPVLSPAAMFVDDAANRATSALTNKASALVTTYLKSPMATTPSSRVGDLENTTPRQQLERRASLSYVDRRTSFWTGADN